MAKKKDSGKIRKKRSKPKTKPKPKPKPEEQIPVREEDIKIQGSQEQYRKGRLAHSYPEKTKKGFDIVSPFAGGGMVTFHFRSKSYLANEKAALRVLNYYKKYLSTWQIVKAWYAKSPIKQQKDRMGVVLRDRKKGQGWAGKGKIVGYSTGRNPSQINIKMINFAVRETQISVKAAIAGAKQEYNKSVAIIFKPASFSTSGNKMEFALNIFFDKEGLKYFKRQQQLK